MDADWDLLAVVRGCTTSTSASSASTAAPSSSPAREPPLLAPPTTHHIPPAGFEELQDYLYKPFPQENMSCTLSTGTPEGVEFDHEQLQQRKQPQQLVFQSNPPQKEQKEYSQFIFGSTASATATTSASSIMSVGSVITPHIQRNNVLCSSTTTTPHFHQRSKKRKNLQKRVCHVGAEGLSSDMWAWRKYGQKPIKGSPYPRGYYRCSSSKGCLARKQVERNRSDPKMFIITYTSEHNHPMPTHRNSLAGSTRHKPATDAAAAANPEEASAAAASSGSGSPVAEEKGDQMKEDYEDEMEFKDMVMNDDFFVGFEELDDSDGGDLDFFPDQIQGGLDMGCHLVGQQQ